MLPTPSTSHVDYDHIYEPAEDSFLLIDTLVSDSETSFLQSRFPLNSPSPLVLEVGTGSGVVLGFATAHASRIFGRADVTTLGTDLNRFACLATSQTVQQAVSEAGDQAGLFLGCLNVDLVGAIKTRTVDVLIFNPPYVPSESLPETSNLQDASEVRDAFTRDSHLLSLSTDGGQDGMEITNRLISQLDCVLSTHGVAYILLCAQNKPDEVMARTRKMASTTVHRSWSVEKVSSSGNKAAWERLCVIRIWRTE